MLRGIVSGLGRNNKEKENGEDECGLLGARNDRVDVRLSTLG